MFRSLFISLSAAIFAVVFNLPGFAIDVAVPRDFPAFDLIDNDPTNQGYYYCSGQTVTPPPQVVRPYAFILDARGNVAWYYTDHIEHQYFSHISGEELMVIVRGGSGSDNMELMIFDEQYSICDVIPRENPFRPSMSMDMHEVRIDSNGNLYTLWYDPVEVDMSLWVEGGQPDAIVNHATIQQWDLDGNFLWEWRSVDHVDQLPYTARTNQLSLLLAKFEHLHVNSVQVLDDGDLIVNGLGMNVIFQIDRATGNIEWLLGGDLNEFEAITDLELPPDVDIGFFPAHDAHLYSDNRLSLFDNGRQHTPKRAYGREYLMDFNSMTAELTWYYYHPDDFYSPSQGSLRISADDKRLIGWGGGMGPREPTINATEVTAADELVWEIRLYSNSIGVGEVPDTYRWYKLDHLNQALEPYLSEVSDATDNSIELYANWFGHEGEVDGYQVYVGLTENTLQLVGTTQTGVYTMVGLDPMQTYWCQVIPINGGGDPIGPPSNVIDVMIQMTHLDLDPVVQLVPAAGGTIVYNASFTLVGDQPETLIYRTHVDLPNGNEYGPLSQIYFTMQPNTTQTVNGMTLEVPAYAPAGYYVFKGSVQQVGGGTPATDRFEFAKQGAAEIDGLKELNLSDWISSDELFISGPIREETEANSESPGEFSLGAAYPNPFNASTTLTISLPHASLLQVSVHDVLGREVAMLANGTYTAGSHAISFDGSGLASGLYFVRAIVPGETTCLRKILIIK